MPRGISNGGVFFFYGRALQGLRKGALFAVAQGEKRDRQRGFSLVEVLITVGMLAIVCLTLISVFVYGFNLVSGTKQTTLATQVAQYEAERYRNMEFDSINPQSPTTSTFATLYNAAADSPYRYLFNSDGHAYLRNGRETITIQAGEAINMDESIKKLTVTIEWDYRNRTIASGNPMRKDVVTFISKAGINRR